jgi:hypothetical protein
MQRGVRIHITFDGIDDAAYEALKGDLVFDHVERKGKTIIVDHDGFYLDLEELLEKAAGLMAPGADTRADYIDFDMWEITRYVVKDGEVTRKTFPLNDVLQQYQYE